jgi:hypothetical protein
LSHTGSNLEKSHSTSKFPEYGYLERYGGRF